jgi:4'-phosphopantetheinyl transferase
MTDTETPWTAPAADLEMPLDEVHVWRCRLELPSRESAGLTATLSPVEKNRAARFVREEDMRRFIFSHRALRSILGSYLHVGPERIAFRVNRYGKPFLAGRFKESDMRFNMAHSGKLALVAVTRGREIGVDVEVVRDAVDFVQIADRFFSIEEKRYLRSQPSAKMEEAFFRCWSRKEACIKALGKGLSCPLDTFSVVTSDDDGDRTVIDDLCPNSSSSWHLTDLSPGPGYVGALAVADFRAEPRHLQYDHHGFT